ncbi:hypothetical protein J4E86_003672 [Alternaria arbusti]|uniref:uncharacterized protein n=1 Tax=Alternaria arbusti TaxID=232088 RepID=UPI00221F3A48|nr:uncharacterized protein J4E86_003672 [Alternaria arbusti]KAI4958077.1 hypothetical protein J4E86_003672 [Alternaria arbusti]
MFKQAPQTGYVQHENYEIMLRAEVEERCANASEKTPNYTGSVTSAYKVTLRNGNSAAGVVHKELEAVFFKRKMVLKKIRKSIRNIIVEEFAQEMRSLLKALTKSTTTGLTAGKGGAPKSIRKQAKDAQTELEGLYGERMSAIEALKRRNEQDEIIEPDVDQEEGLNMDSLEENNDKQHPPDESLHWQDCPLRGRLSEHS